MIINRNAKDENIFKYDKRKAKKPGKKKCILFFGFEMDFHGFPWILERDLRKLEMDI